MRPSLEHATARAVARARNGKSVSVDEASALMQARDDHLLELMSIASGLRELGHGSRVTYSRKVFIPLTMLCRDHCHYCTFAKPPAKLDRPFLLPEEVVATAAAGARLGCKEALFTLGDRPEERYPIARGWLTPSMTSRSTSGTLSVSLVARSARDDSAMMSLASLSATT